MKRLTLSRYGFIPGGIVEAVVSTYDETGKPNAAPMGATTEDLRTLIIKPYLKTTTYKNLKVSRCAVVNITTDPWLFYVTALKEVSPEGSVPRRLFSEAKKVKAPRLIGAQGFIEVSVVSIEERGKRGIVTCEVVHTEAKKALAKAYCRGAYAAIEAIIHATRVKEALAAGNAEEAAKLEGLINYYRDLVKRVSRGTAYEAIVEGVLNLIKRWKG